MFKRFRHIFLLLTFLVFITCKSNSRDINVFFLGDSIHLNIDDKFFVQAEGNLSDQFIHTFYLHVNESNYLPIIQALKSFQNKYQLNDWLYYQLIRSTAQAISPKGENYHRYTLYKWFLLAKSGYEATLSFSEKNLLFYVRSDDNIYGIPFFKRDEKQYVCLNYHDYGKIDFEKEIVVETTLRIEEANKSFSYKITQLPDFRPDDYQIKELQFNYQDKVYHFKVKLNTQVKNMFTNYPVADFETYFNIPLSKETYSSLIPELKKNIQELSQANGVDYLMRFTRYSFLYENDQINFGKEKRLSPEQTLLYEHSDCDDRAALFFYLVKEIYNLPMIVLLYPTHVTIAVQFDHPIGKPIIFNGKTYSMCDPTPQSKDLEIGQIDRNRKHQPYEVVYEYIPSVK